MFTGIVQTRGRVAAVEPRPFGVHLRVDRRDWSDDQPALGDSVCVSGVCLTVTESDGQLLHFDVVAETLARSTLGSLQPGTSVNLEPALTPNTPLGGHFVQGHIDGIGRVTRIQQAGGEARITIEPDLSGQREGGSSLMEAIIPKGSVAVDGVSLTVAAVERGGFEIALIPTTLGRTTLGEIAKGDRVNLETDMISRTVVGWLNQRFGTRKGSNVTMDTLRQAGFVD